MERDVTADVADRDGPEHVVVGYPMWVVGWAHPHFKHVTEFAFDAYDQGGSALTVKLHERQCVAGGPLAHP